MTTLTRVSSWWWVLAALLLIYVPTYFDLFKTFAGTQYGSYGPIVLLACIWLIWRDRAFFALPTVDRISIGAVLLFGLGLLMFVLGRSQSFYQLEVGSQIPLLASIALFMYGRPGLRKFWFPIALLVFVVPVPGSILDQMLLLLKQWVSFAADSLLHLAGYPTARSGVVLSIGPYQLLMADACAGLNSIITLSGLGSIYIYLNWKDRAVPVSLLLIFAILPLAFIANVLRVMSLMLVTYWSGEAAGALLHDYAGYCEILLLFFGLFWLDGLLQRCFRFIDKPVAKGIANATH